MAIMAIFIGARLFQLYKEPYMNHFIIEAFDGVYRPPGRRLIGGELLDQQYQELKQKIKALICSQDKLYFILDKSLNISL